MAVQSMTGFGAADGPVGNNRVKVEIRALNSKFMDLNFKWNQQDVEKEMILRTLVSDKLKRGKVDVMVTFESKDSEGTLQINEELFKNYAAQLKGLADDSGLSDQFVLKMVTEMPGVINTRSSSLGDEGWTQLKALVETALANLVEFRSQEGSSLQNDLSARINAIQAHSAQVESMEEGRKEALKTRLEQLVADWNSKVETSDNRMELEMLYYLDRLDISEEKTRLANHCEQFVITMEDGDDVMGKKLGFISQEIGREVNTLGAKSYYSPLQNLVVEMKDELEKIKEQINNVL